MGRGPRAKPRADGLTDTLGRPVRDLRISITDRCNFRCTYCMPAEIFGERYTFLPREAILSYEETARLTRLFVDLGVSKVRITGGEPLVRRNVERLVEMLDRIDGIDDLTLTTNGYLLAEQAEALYAAGLRRVTVSLDSLDPQVFGAMNGRGYGPEAVLDGIAAAERAGLAPVKINAVVERGVNDHTALDMVRRFKGSGHIVRFIEYMDVGNLNGWRREQVVPSAELVERINAVYPIEPLAPNYRGEVAERWRFVDGDGEIGFISSVTSAVLRRLHARAALARGPDAHLPLRTLRPRPDDAAARRGVGRRAERAHRRRMARPRRPLLRTADRSAPRRRRTGQAQDRDVPDRRLTATPARCPNARPAPTMCRARRTRT